MAPFGLSFYAFFVFDILGNEKGYAEALWAPIVMCVIPLCIAVTISVVREAFYYCAFGSSLHAMVYPSDSAPVNPGSGSGSGSSGSTSVKSTLQSVPESAEQEGGESMVAGVGLEKEVGV